MRKPNRVFLRCAACGNAMICYRENSDPPGTVSVVTNECAVCDAATGGFMECWYFDQHGNELEVA